IKTKNEVASVHASDNNRSEKVNYFREKSLYCLITTTILERGVTFPSVDVIVIQADNQVFNSAGLVQISGRAGRSVKDQKGDVYYLINNNKEEVQIIYLKKNTLYCLNTTTILERGVTFLSVDVIVIQADNQVFNSAGLVQISGRAGRSVKDPKGDVYFLINNNTEAIQKSLKDLRYMNKLAKENML